ncbi:MAG: NAD-dependent epimerase/dehydratase family protein [Actinomycetota bacterium]|nr:NAD-dependent epimerase/dehydratase family protein [Actinomycetota bacterium]
MPRVVMVTGVARDLAGRVVRRLSEDPGIERVIGVDLLAPAHPIGRGEFVRADIRSPLVGRLITQAEVDTVVHLGVIATPRDAGGRVVQKDINVLGTMQLLAACQKTPSVRRLVVKSTAGIYGSSPRDPAVFTEDMTARAMPRSGFARDSIEVEGYVRGLSRRRPDIEVSLLRMANVVGPSIRTVLTEYFTLALLPVPLGHDGRLQFLHEDDAVAALVRATSGPVVGACNIAGDGVLATSQAVAMSGRPWIPVAGPAGRPVHWAMRRLGLAAMPSDQQALLSYGRVVDTARMRTELGFAPAYTTRAAFESFLAATRAYDRPEQQGGRRP